MKRNGFVLTLSVVLLILAGAVPRRAESAKDTWLKVRSKHFTLIGNASEKEIGQVGARLEQFREAVSRLFDQRQRQFTPPITVFVFKDRVAFTPFKTLYQGKPSEISGYFQASDDAAYIALATDWQQADPYAVIFHEYVHFLVKERLGELPSWLAEGLGEYYSSCEFPSGGKKITLGKAIPAHIQNLRRGEFLSLEELFSVNGESPLYNEPGKKNLFYAESWVLVHYLIQGSGAKYQPQLQQLLDSIAIGQSAESAFKRVFQDDLAELEGELRQYIRRGIYMAREISFERKIEFDESMQITPLSEAETQTYLGDLLWHINRRDEGEAVLQRVLAMEPQLEAANTSLGLLRIRQNRFAEARKFLRLAIEANSTNYLAHYYHAFAWQQEYVDVAGYVSDFPPEVVAGMRASLNRARELAPEFAGTYKTLAFINVVQKEKLDEALVLIKRALELAPKRQDFAYTLAQVYLQLHDFAAAHQTAKQIVDGGENPDIRERAGFLLQIIAKTEEDLARTKAEEETRRQQSSQRGTADDPTRPPGKRFEGEQARGVLTRIECTDTHITLTVVSGVRVLKFRAEQGKMAFVRHTMEIPNQITCGAMVPARQVIVTYRKMAGGNPKLEGEPVAIEFPKSGTT